LNVEEKNLRLLAVFRGVMTSSRMTLSKNDIEPNDAQQNDIYHFA
jgi:hypothetical protein